jgi:D-alanine transaminase/branched-chain amino acid aminotransferase
MSKWVFLKDSFIEEEKACLHFGDLSFQRGYGIFDFCRLVENEPLFLDDHLDRFYFSAEAMHLRLTYSREEIKKLIKELIQQNNLTKTGVRLSLTGGYPADGFSIAKPSFIISQHSFLPPDPEQVKTGIRLLSYPYQRQLSHVKTIDYLMAIWLQPLLKEKNADEILYHQNGWISECPRSNFFLIMDDDRILTPSENVLRGITRKKIIELAKRQFQVEERAIHMDELQKAKEAFITSTTKQILPVAQIDDVVFTERKISNHLLAVFRSAC